MVPLLFFFNDTATTEIYTLSLHDALPIFESARQALAWVRGEDMPGVRLHEAGPAIDVRAVRRKTGLTRSEEHTSELQSRQYLVCRLLLEKKKKYCQS